MMLLYLLRWYHHRRFRNHRFHINSRRFHSVTLHRRGYFHVRVSLFHQLNIEAKWHMCSNILFVCSKEEMNQNLPPLLISIAMSLGSRRFRPCCGKPYEGISWSSSSMLSSSSDSKICWCGPISSPLSDFLLFVVRGVLSPSVSVCTLYFGK